MVVKSIWQAPAIFFLSAMLALAVNVLRPDQLAWVGNWSPEAQLIIDNGENLAIPLAEAEAFFQAGAALFLDARSPELYGEGHIAGARNLPWERFDARVDAVMQQISQDTLIITYCDGKNCNLSKELAMALMERGYVNVRVLPDGWTLWHDNLLPIATGPEP